MRSKVAILSMLKKRPFSSWENIYKRNDLILRNIGLHDMLIFNEGEYKEVDFSELSKTYPKIKFINIEKDWRKKSLLNLFNQKMGYKNMCSFFATKIWKYLKDYDYVIRLDDDSFLHTSIIDIVDDLDKNKFDFFYIRRKLDDHRPTEKTFPLFLSKYFPNHSFIKDIAMKNFYNNFQIVKVDFFLNPKVQLFLSDIEKTNNIFKLRWGDSNIWSSTAHAFGAEVCQIKNIDYEHKSHKYRSSPNPNHEWEISESPLINHHEIKL